VSRSGPSSGLCPLCPRDRRNAHVVQSISEIEFPPYGLEFICRPALRISAEESGTCSKNLLKEQPRFESVRIGRFADLAVERVHLVKSLLGRILLTKHFVCRS
jgi:hypothetical protein